MDDFLAAVFCTILLIFAILGGIFAFSDHRHFDNITKQCAQRGYIQNDTTRIICHPEVRP